MRLPQTLNLSNAGTALAALRSAAATGEGTALIIDASALRTFDTAALALLLQARRLAQAAGRELQVRDAPAPLIQLAQLYGVGALLGWASPAC